MQLSNITRIIALRNSTLLKSHFHTSVALSAGKWWRIKNNLPPTVRDGRIVDDADWSYIDSDKEVPLNPSKKRKHLLQIEICKKIIAANKEVDFIVSDHAKALENAVKEKRRKLDTKLKPKGNLLLANATKTTYFIS